MRPLLLKLHVWLVAFIVPLLVRVMSLKALLRLLTPAGRVCPYRALAVEQIVDVVNRRLARPVNMRRRACLRRALTLFHFLRLAGRPAVIHFGVYDPADEPIDQPANEPANEPVNEQSRMRGHCWVTLGHRTVDDPPGGPCTTVMKHGPGAD